jgi:hypothetical protein
MNREDKEFVERVQAKLSSENGIRIEKVGEIKSPERKGIKIKGLKNVLPSRVSSRQIVSKSPRATVRVNVDDYKVLGKMERDKQRFFKQEKEFLYK